jgi:hypothetical protein
MEGTGGLGFFMLDADDNIVYASNAKNVYIPTIVGNDFTIYSYDADGSLHEVTKAGNGTEYVELATAGTLRTKLENNQVIKLILKGPINTTDLNYMKQLVTNENLKSIDLEQAVITNFPNTFQSNANLVVIKLPLSLTSIAGNAFSHSSLKSVIIPDNVTSIGGDAFAYNSGLTSVVIGKSVKTMEQGVFYGSGNIKEAYVLPLTPPQLNGVSDYLFSGNKRTIHVYASALEAYQAANWERFGTLVGDLTDEMVDGIQAIGEEQEDMANGQWPMANGSTYDLFGRKVTDPKPGNIYIRGGKKFMPK